MSYSKENKIAQKETELFDNYCAHIYRELRVDLRTLERVFDYKPERREYLQDLDSALWGKYRNCVLAKDTAGMSKHLLHILLNKLCIACQAEEHSQKPQFQRIQGVIDRQRQSHCFVYDQSIKQVELVLVLFKGVELIRRRQIQQLAGEYYTTFSKQFESSRSNRLSSQFHSACCLARIRLGGVDVDLLKICINRRQRLLAECRSDEHGHLSELTVFILLKALPLLGKVEHKLAVLRRAKQLLERYDKLIGLRPKQIFQRRLQQFKDFERQHWGALVSELFKGVTLEDRLNSAPAYKISEFQCHAVYNRLLGLEDQENEEQPLMLNDPRLVKEVTSSAFIEMEPKAKLARRKEQRVQLSPGLFGEYLQRGPQLNSLIQEVMIEAESEKKMDLRRLSIVLQEQKSRSSNKSSLNLKSRSSIHYSLAENFDLASLDEIKSEYKRSKKVGRQTEKQKKLHKTMIKLNFMRKQTEVEKKEQPPENIKVIYQSLKNFENKRRREKETLLSSILPGDLRAQVLQIEGSLSEFRSIEISRELVLQKSAHFKPMTVDALRALFKQLIEVYDHKYYEKMDRARLKRLALLRHYIRQHVACEKRNKVMHVLLQNTQPSKQQLTDEFTFNRLQEGRLIVFKLSYRVEQGGSVLILSSGEGVLFSIQLGGGSGSRLQDCHSEWPNVYRQLQKMIKNSSLYFQIFQRIENDQDEVMADQLVQRYLSRKKIKFSSADIAHMLQLRNLILDTFKCMTSPELRLCGNSFRRLGPSEVSSKGEILNLLYSLQRYAFLMSKGMSQHRNRLQIPARAVQSFQDSLRESGFMIIQAMSEKHQELKEYINSIVGRRSLLFRGLLPYDRSFLLLCLSFRLDLQKCQSFDRFEFDFEIHGCELGSQKRQVKPLRVEQAKLKRLLRAKLNLQFIVSYWIYQGRQLKATQRDLLLKVLPAVKVRLDQDLFKLALDREYTQEAIVFLVKPEAKGIKFARTGLESGERSHIQNLFRKNLEEIMEREMLFGTLAKDSGELKVVEQTFGEIQAEAKEKTFAEIQYGRVKKRGLTNYKGRVLITVFNCRSQDPLTVREPASLLVARPKVSLGVIRAITRSLNLQGQMQQVLRQSLTSSCYKQHSSVDESLVMSRANTVKLHMLHRSAELTRFFRLRNLKLMVRDIDGAIINANVFLHERRKPVQYEYLLELSLLSKNQRHNSYRVFLTNFDVEMLIGTEPLPLPRMVANICSLLQFKRMSSSKKAGFRAVVDKHYVKRQTKMKHRRKYLLMNKMGPRGSVPQQKSKHFLQRKLLYKRHLASVSRVCGGQLVLVTLQRFHIFNLLIAELYIPQTSLRSVGFIYMEQLASTHKRLAADPEVRAMAEDSKQPGVEFLQKLLAAFKEGDRGFVQDQELEEARLCRILLKQATLASRQGQTFLTIFGLEVPMMRVVAEEYFQLQPHIESDMLVEVNLSGLQDRKEYLRLQQTSSILFFVKVYSFNKHTINTETVNFRQVYNIYKAGIFFQSYAHSDKLPLRLLLDLGSFIISRIRQTNFLDLTSFHLDLRRPSFITHLKQFCFRFMRSDYRSFLFRLQPGRLIFVFVDLPGSQQGLSLVLVQSVRLDNNQRCRCLVQARIGHLRQAELIAAARRIAKSKLDWFQFYYSNFIDQI